MSQLRQSGQTTGPKENIAVKEALATHSRAPKDAPEPRNIVNTENVRYSRDTFERYTLSSLTEDQQGLFNWSRDFSNKEIVPITVQMDEGRQIDPHLLNELKKVGYFGIKIPEEYGGAGLKDTEAAIITQNIAYGSGSVAVMLAVSSGLGGFCLGVGTQEQKRKFLPKIASGEIITCFALTEPEGGSNAAAIQGHAEKVDGGWRLNGTKRFITNAPIADYAIIFLLTDKENGKMSAFLVPRGEGGYTPGKPEDKIGWRASATSDVILENVFVPDENLIGGDAWKNRGFKLAMMALDRGRLSIAAQALGVAERAYDEALKYTLTRKGVGGELLCTQDGIRTDIVNMATRLELMRSILYRALSLADNNDDFTQAAMAKLVCSEGVEYITQKAMEIHGGSGYMNEYAVAVCFRDGAVYKIVEGTSFVQRLVIARQTFGF